jgi:hypothetical protein
MTGIDRHTFFNHTVYQLTPYDLQRLLLYNWEWEAGL